MSFQKMLRMTTEKRVFLGGLLGGFTYWANRSAREFWAGYPPELGDRLDPHLPTNGQIVASVAPPGVLYLAKKVSKSTTTKEKVGDVAFGSVLYCIPHLIEKTGANAAYAEGAAARPAVAVARVPATYKVSAVAPTRTVAPTVGKYRVTA